METAEDQSKFSLNSVTERLAALMPCDDKSCCCIPRRSTVIIISIINFFGCVMDLMSSDTCMSMNCQRRALVDSVRKVLVTLFQMANLMLLLASILENAFLLDVYVWFTLGFIVMGFVVTIYEFVSKLKRVGARNSLLTFIPEVIFFFVIFRCLPLVDLYRRHLYTATAVNAPAEVLKAEVSKTD